MAIFSTRYGSGCILFFKLKRFLQTVPPSKQGIISKSGSVSCYWSDCVPVTSVNCERGISPYNSIKTDSRSGLSVTSTDMLLMLSLEAKPIEKFDVDLAFSHWVMAKDRHGYVAMLKKSQCRKSVSGPRVCQMPTNNV